MAQSQEHSNESSRSKNKKQAKRIKGFDEYIEVQDQRIKKLEEFDQNLNKAGVYRFTQDLEDQIAHLQARISEAEIEKEIQDDLAQEFMYGHPYSNTDDPEYPDDPRDYPEEQYE
mgnify:CR=1 FL=1